MSKWNYPSKWTAIFLAEAIIPEWAHLTVASVVTFTTEGKIIAILQPRWLGIPCGHIEPNETPEQAGIRESFEEAAISGLSELTLICVIRGDLGYMLAYTADLITMETFQAENTNGEVLERIEMFPEDFLKDPRVGKISQEIVRRAYAKKENNGETPIFEEVALEIW